MTDRKLKQFDPGHAAVQMELVNRFTAGWPYSRPIDSGLIAHWQSIERFQPENMLTAWEAGVPAAFLHGEVHGDNGHINILAVQPAHANAGAWLLNEWEHRLVGCGVRQVRGPSARAGAFYGGFVIGLEPYLPSWATGAIDAFIRAGYRMGPPDVLMTLDLTHRIDQDPISEGYEIIEVEPEPEYTAEVFGYHALSRRSKAAHCYARIYPQLPGASGAIGQIGNVTTEPEHRNRGLARCMVQKSLRRLAAMGATEALIATGLENAPALRAYERVGFRRLHLITEWIRDL